MSDQAKVEKAIRGANRDRVIHHTACRHVAGRQWHCVLRTAPIERGTHDLTEVCDVTAGSDASKLAHFRCRD